MDENKKKDYVIRPKNYARYKDKDKYSEHGIIGTMEFTRLLAEESGFSLGSSKIFLRAMEAVIARILENDMELNLSGFGKFYSTSYTTNVMVQEKIADDKIYHMKKIVFKPSVPLKRKIRNLNK